MKCPFCGYHESKVIDSRPTNDGTRIKRRRECMECQKRFTTYEIVEAVPMIIIKKDGSRQTYDRSKLIKGMLRACEKRPVSIETIEDAVDAIEQKMNSSLEQEVTSDKIGELVMEKLLEIDEVAYIRFASVYRQFSDANSFLKEIQELLNKKKN